MFWKKPQKVKNLTLENLELKMNERNFDEDFIQVILNFFKRRMETQGEENFQRWLSNLHFRVPEEFQEEKTATQFYVNHKEWMEKEIAKLEVETKLSWEMQAEDIQYMSVAARKAIVVIRHRISEIVLDVEN